MRYEEAYANVPVGLEAAPKHLRDAYLSPFSKCIIEALLVDKTTPIGVYTDLLGWTDEDVDEYRKYFFNVDPDMPRLQMYEFIRSAPENTDADQIRKNLLIGVFNYGWSYIDSKYNRSNRIVVQNEVNANVKKLFGSLSAMVDKCVKHPTMSNMRALIAFMREGVATVNETDTNSQDPTKTLSLGFVEETQNEVKARTDSSSRIMGLQFDEIMRLKAIEGAEKQELDVIRNDVSNG